MCEHVPLCNHWHMNFMSSPAQIDHALQGKRSHPNYHTADREPVEAVGGVGEVQFLEFSRVLLAELAARTMDLSDVRMAKQCIFELERVAAGLGNEWRVKPFGGIANGFAAKGSDLDVTCYVEGAEASYRPMAAQSLRTHMRPILEQHPRFEVVEQIWTARVPILKLRFDGKLDVDLSCHNTEALPNTRLLRAYAELSPVVRELGLMVKLWAKQEGVSGARQGYLSSYALTLMALYYLQVDPEVQLPCLATGRYRGEQLDSERTKEQESERLDRPWQCGLQTQVLMIRFLRFYATEFQWCTEVVSVRHGRRAPASHPAYAQLGSSSCPRLHIEDPFLTSRNLNCVLGPQQELFFYSRICQTVEALQSGRPLHTPELPWTGQCSTRDQGCMPVAPGSTVTAASASSGDGTTRSTASSSSGGWRGNTCAVRTPSNRSISTSATSADFSTGRLDISQRQEKALINGSAVVSGAPGSAMGQGPLQQHDSPWQQDRRF